jgi:ABC-type transport system involved in multi-copper enzyme maturation permease subunit
MNTWVIARNTLGDALRKRVLLVFLLLAMVGLMMALMLQYFTAREQMVTFKSTELAIVVIFGALIAITTSIFLIPNEIEKRTIYSVLSKPVQRWEFFLGKFLGGVLTAAVTLGLMTIVLMIVVFILSARPPAADELINQGGQAAGVNAHEWMARGFREIMLVLQGCYVIFFELILVTGIATTLSLFFSPTVNFAATAFIFITGSLQDVLAAWTRRNDLPVTRALASAFYYMTPHFEDFNIMGHIVHPEVKLGMPMTLYAIEVSLYGVIYAAMILLLGVLVFERKEV